MLERARKLLTALASPPARLLLRLGVTPDQVTLAGTAAFVAAALGTIPFGHHLLGGVLIALIALTDGIDGQMARLTQPTRFGALLDSTLDRVADGALGAALILWFAGQADQPGVALAAAALVTGQVVPYARARAESVGLDGRGGLAGRADRIALAAIGLGLAGLGLPRALTVSVALMAILGAVTVVQRLVQAWRSSRATKT